MMKAPTSTSESEDRLESTSQRLHLRSLSSPREEIGKRIRPGRFLLKQQLNSSWSGLLDFRISPGWASQLELEAQMLRA
jgi:hypothetical protein